MGKIASFMAESDVKRLEVERVRVIDGVADFAIGEEFVEGVALFDANGVLVKNVVVLRGDLRGHDTEDFSK